MSCHDCKYYSPWVTTSRGEIRDACVDDERRRIKQCDHLNHPEECPDYKEREGVK